MQYVALATLLAFKPLPHQLLDIRDTPFLQVPNLILPVRSPCRALLYSIQFFQIRFAQRPLHTSPRPSNTTQGFRQRGTDA
jgi:hypothetical protein